MEGVGGVIAKKAKKIKIKSSTSFQEKKRKYHYYVWICLNKGRDGFFPLTKACY